MDLKNTTILLIFLMCILGLLVGVYYTETTEPTMKTIEYEETVHEDSAGTITIELEAKETSSLSKFFT